MWRQGGSEVAIFADLGQGACLQHMKLSFVEPRPELQPYIESLWTFESPIGFPALDASIAAPNGCCKLTLILDNPIVRIANGRAETGQPHRLYFMGIRDSSTLLRSSCQKTGCIVVEFRPHGAFPIFGTPMADVFNRHWKADVLFGKWARDTQEILGNLRSVNEKVAFLQGQLVGLLQKNGRTSDLVIYCVQELKAADGRLSIQDLARATGYSRRYLSLLFKQHVGLPPKVLAGIFRFQRFYKKLVAGESFDLIKDDLYECYYDQSHFTKEFKKMTGYSPRGLASGIVNDLGRLHSFRQISHFYKT